MSQFIILYSSYFAISLSFKMCQYLVNGKKVQTEKISAFEG